MHKTSAWSSESPEASFVLPSFAIAHGRGLQGLWLSPLLHTQGKALARRQLGRPLEQNEKLCAAANACRRYITVVCYQLSQAVKASNLWLTLTLLGFCLWLLPVMLQRFLPLFDSGRSETSIMEQIYSLSVRNDWDVFLLPNHSANAFAVGQLFCLRNGTQNLPLF